jgi:hypothetical protein
MYSIINIKQQKEKENLAAAFFNNFILICIKMPTMDDSDENEKNNQSE